MVRERDANLKGMPPCRRNTLRPLALQPPPPALSKGENGCRSSPLAAACCTSQDTNSSRSICVRTVEQRGVQEVAEAAWTSRGGEEEIYVKAQPEARVHGCRRPNRRARVLWSWGYGEGRDSAPWRRENIRGGQGRAMTACGGAGDGRRQPERQAAAASRV